MSEPVPLFKVAEQATVKDASDLAIARKSEKPQEHKGSDTRNAERRGGIAQLGEHLLCKQGVKGSNPFISTIRADSSAPGDGASQETLCKPTSKDVGDVP